MRILITGAAGFIGSHLFDYFEKQGHQVIGIDNFSHPSKHPIVKRVGYGDVRYPATIFELVKEVDTVYHLASQIHVDKSIHYPHETVDINVGGTLNVLEACRKYGKKLIFASSSEVYGTAQTEFIDEKHQLDVQSPYAASKVAGDRLCWAYNETYGMDVSILRNFNTWGPYQADGGEGSSYGAVIGIFTRQALAGQPLTVFGDGLQERDYIWIDDAIEGYKLASKIKGVINIGTGKTIKILDLAKKVIEITGSKSEIVHLDSRPGEVMRLCANINKAKGLGFISKTNFDENLRQYIDWYKTNK